MPVNRAARVLGINEKTAHTILRVFRETGRKKKVNRRFHRDQPFTSSDNKLIKEKIEQNYSEELKSDEESKSLTDQICLYHDTTPANYSGAGVFQATDEQPKQIQLIEDKCSSSFEETQYQAHLRFDFKEYRTLIAETILNHSTTST